MVDNERDGSEVAIIKLMTAELNIMGNSGARFGKRLSQALQRQHRTLQQLVIKALVTCLVDYSLTASADGRNECALQLAKEIREGLKKSSCYDAENDRVILPVI